MGCLRRCKIVFIGVMLAGWIGGATVAQSQSPQGAAAAADQAKVTEQLAARRQVVDEEKTVNARLRRELESLAENLPQRMQELKPDDLTATRVEQARVDANSARLRLEDLRADITVTERRIKELEQSIRDLEAREQLLKNPAKEGTEGADRSQQLADTHQALAQQRIELGLETQHLANMRERLDLATRRLGLLEQWRNRLDEAYRLQQEQNRRAAQEGQEAQLQQEQQAHLDRAAELRRTLETEREKLSDARRRLLETSIESAEEMAKLTQTDILLARAESSLERLQELADLAEPELKVLQAGLEQVTELRNELRAASDLLERKIDLLGQQKQVIARYEGLSGADTRYAAQEAEVVQELLNALNGRAVRAARLLDTAIAIRNRLEALYQERLRKNLLSRRQLPGSAEEWGRLLEGVLGAPRVLLYQVRLSLETAVSALASATILRWLGLAALEGGLLWLGWAARRSVVRAIDRIRDRGETSFVSNTLLIGLILLRMNLFGIGVTLAVAIALAVLQVPQPGLGILLTLVLLWIGIKIPVTLAWLLLASPHLAEEKRRPQLYRQLRWSLLAGGIVAAVIILARLSLLPEPVIGFFDRVFMLYLLLAFIPVFWLRRYVIDLLAQRYAEHVWFVSLRVISLFLPLSLLVAAGLGLAGFLNLAWEIAWHLVIFIAVLTGWQMVRGLLDDLAVWLKNFAVTHSGYGLLWTQEVINPLHKILKMVLFVGAWVVLFQAYGLEGESTLVATAWGVLEQPLFSIGGAEITLWRIIVTVMSIMLVVWLGQWSRAVTYRWVYSRVLDLGARHSLSVFTQYAIVLIGFMVILRVIGLDLTTLTVFAGAVGVGIGFGMQAIANNFISGLLLLIERPLRSGDIVKIGASEGEVTRIGIRSLTMKTFDNMEVIIPNSDVITNAFTNWTHSDQVIRTVFTIRVAYDADPAKAVTLIERVVTTHAAVVRDPEPIISLWEFTDSCLLVRVHYFIDIKKYHILRVRSEILAGIYETLKKAGIRIPFPQQDLHIKEWPRELVAQLQEDESRLAAGQDGPRPVGRSMLGL